MYGKRSSPQLFRLLILMLFTTVLCRSVNASITTSGSTSANPTAENASPVIGVSDIGRLTITDNSALTSNAVILGDLLNGFGIATVTDFDPGAGLPSIWAMNSLIVGDEGTGRLEVRNGAVVSIDFSTMQGAGDVLIGNSPLSVGTVIVDGLGSMLRMGDETTVGANGTGTMQIKNEAFVNATNSVGGNTDMFLVGPFGRVEFSTGGRLRTQDLTNNGVIIGSGRIDNTGTIANSATGHIEARDGDRLVVNAVVSNVGEIAAHGGEIEFFKQVTSSNVAAEVTLRDGGTITFPSTGFGYDSTSGTLASVAGVNDIYGTVRLQGASSRILFGGESTAIFHDLVTNAGGAIDVFPGSSVVLLGGLVTAGSGSVLSIHLAEPGGDPGFGQVEVNGAAQLDGNVEIRLAPGFVPTAGDTFTILSAGSVTGTLGLGAAPPLPGGMIWGINVGAKSVRLSVVATGDFNANGVVDAADYVMWRNSLGQSGPGLATDANGNQVVDQNDYLFWRARLGNVVAGSAAAAHAPESVPEPSGTVLAVLGAVGASYRTRRSGRGGRLAGMLQ